MKVHIIEVKTQQILVPVDFSLPSQQALQAADVFASERDSHLTLVHVLPIIEVAVMDFTYIQPPEKVAELCDAAEKRLSEWAGLLKTSHDRVSIKVVTGNPVAEIVALSDTYDLVILGTHGRTGLKHFLLGSVAERVIAASHCSVLVIKPPRENLPTNQSSSQ